MNAAKGSALSRYCNPLPASSAVLTPTRPQRVLPFRGIATVVVALCSIHSVNRRKGFCPFAVLQQELLPFLVNKPDGPQRVLPFRGIATVRLHESQ